MSNITKKTSLTTITQRPAVPRLLVLLHLMKSAARLEELGAKLQEETDKEILKTIDQFAKESWDEPEEEEG